MDHVTSLILSVLVTMATMVHAAMELPKFNQMKLLYPGYYLHGGTYRDHEVLDLIGGEQRDSLDLLHNTAALRISWALNQYGGRHSIGTEPVLLSDQGQDSVPGKDGQQQYIFRNTALGPFLAGKYGNPLVAKPDKRDHDRTMAPFVGKQGIVRLVSFKKKHAGGHTGLWDCDHFYRSRDWTSEVHIIAVEFWETPDSYCAPDPLTLPPTPHLEVVEDADFKVIARHNLDSPYAVPARTPRPVNQLRTRHNRRSRKGQSETLWIQ